jgi:protein-L-isoaspartate(D-aspartate) O-methyltransferase
MGRLFRLVGSVVCGTALFACSAEGPMGFEEARHEMIEKQLTGPGRDISDPRVIEAMETVPRHEFVPEELKYRAYEDRPLPIGHEQTISQPFIVAFMTEKLEPKASDRVLEIGTGSGYQAAVLSRLVKELYSIEIVEPLAERAQMTLGRLGYDNVTVRAGDGYRGWPEHAPFDAIMVTAAPDHVPEPLVKQLKEGGRLVIPVGKGMQSLKVFVKREGVLKLVSDLPVRFVPMTGEAEK